MRHLFVLCAMTVGCVWHAADARALALVTDDLAVQVVPAAVAQPAQQPQPSVQPAPPDTPPSAQPSAPVARPAPRPPRAPRLAEPRAPGAETRGDIDGPNVQVEVTITDYSGADAPVRRVVTLTVADGETGRVRTQTSGRAGNLPLNVDAVPRVLKDGRVSLHLSFEYGTGDLVKDEHGLSTASTRVNHSAVVVLENGKPLLITQSADPKGDRRVTLEAKATVLR